jgi:O-antigen ligase
MKDKEFSLAFLKFDSSQFLKKYFLLIVFICLFIGILSARYPQFALIMIPLFILLVAPLCFPYEVAFVFIFLLMALGDYLGASPVMIGGFKIYGSDYFVVLLIVLFFRTQKLKIKSPISLLFFIYAIYGFFCLVYGIFYQEHEAIRAIGEFRRFFYYPFSFFLGLNIIRDKKSIVKFEKLIQFIPIIILALASKRIITGVSWAVEIHKTPEDFRAMAYYDGVSLIFVFSYLILLFFIKKKMNFFQIAMVMLIPVFLIFSGFRLLWAQLFLAVGLLIWVIVRQNRKQASTITLLIVLVAILFSVISFRFIGGKYFEAAKAKLQNSFLYTEGQSEKWRLAAWKASIDKFYASPIVGTGLGDEPTFWVKYEKNLWIRQTYSIHNAYIEILYQTGIIGAILFFLVAVRYLIFYLRNIKFVDLNLRPITYALFILLICGSIQSFFQPYLNHPGNGVVFFSVMGVIVGLINSSKNAT